MRRALFVLAGLVLVVAGVVRTFTRESSPEFLLGIAIFMVGVMLTCWTLFNTNVKWHKSGRVVADNLPTFYDPRKKKLLKMIIIEDQSGRTRRLEVSHRTHKRYPVGSQYPWRTL